MNSYIPWVGGKRILRKRIIEEFPSEFDRYIEVFGGAGWVLFGKDKHAPFEVFNDIDGDLINLYRCIKYHAPALAAEKYYNSNFSISDHERLFNVLTGIKGKFVLSYNADDVILELYKDFNIIPVMRFNQLSHVSNNTEYKEVIIKNF